MAYDTILQGDARSVGEGDAASARQSRTAGKTYKTTAHHGNASWLSSNVNLVNTIIGAGTLAMPLAMSHFGMLLGVIIIVWSACCASFGLYLQSRASRYLERGTASFFALSKITYPSAAVFFDGAIAIKCFGVGISYLIIIGDLMPGVVRGINKSENIQPFLVDRHFWITVFMLVVIPLSFLRRLDSLKYTSVVALVSIGYLVVLVIYHYAAGDTQENRGPIRGVKPESALSALSSLPVIVFAYTCHQNMFSIVNEIKDNRPKIISSVIFSSIGSACTIYIIVAITGYLSFGNSVLGNIVQQYEPDVSSTIGKLAIVILVMFSYPLQVHPCRASCVAVLKYRPAFWVRRQERRGSPNRAAPLLNTPGGAGGQLDAHGAPVQVIGDLKFAIITTVIVVLSYLVAMCVNSLDTVLAYVGATGSTSISFILPGLFYFKISSPENPYHQQLYKDNEDLEHDNRLSFDSKRLATLRWMSLALAIYGLVIMVVCLTCITYNLVH